MNPSAAAGRSIMTAAVLLAAACSSPQAAVPGSASATRDAAARTKSGGLGDTLRVELGRSVSVDDGRLVLTFRSHGADSRCPANVVCVWMGDVAVRIAARVGNMAVERELHTGIEPHAMSVDRYVVTVLGLLPYPGTAAADAPNVSPTVLLRVTRR